MINIGDIVKHYKHQERLGVVVAIDKHTILVDWFNLEGAPIGFMPYRYYPFALIKVSK